jgi:hypothetical protein
MKNENILPKQKIPKKNLDSNYIKKPTKFIRLVQHYVDIKDLYKHAKKTSLAILNMTQTMPSIDNQSCNHTQNPI